MGIEVERASGNIQTTTTAPSSAASTNIPKPSIFAKKSGFVIPKNKLSGSLVPIFRGTKKGDKDSTNDDTTSQVQRKTKWGSDLSQDTTVRKGRASAYQTRINQIAQLLTVGALEYEDNEDSLSVSEFQYGTKSGHQLTDEEKELLELERREIIGELLKLNPTYKAPADYKPLLKEAKVPIPIKEYPGYNFIGLVFGPANGTQKRLEKETGAKIRVYGTKPDTGGKVEVTPDDKELDTAYEELYVHVSADTFEKIDAAVALIELLVTPVSVNTTSTTVPDDNVTPANLSQGTSSSAVTPAAINQGVQLNQGMALSYAGPVPPSQGQFPQYPQAWLPAGPTQTAVYPQSGLIAPANSAPPLANNAAQVSSSHSNPSNMPTLFGMRPVIAANFSPVLPNSSGLTSIHQLPQAVQPPFMQQPPPPGQTGGPRNIPVPSLQPGIAQFSTVGHLPNARPVMPIPPQSASSVMFSDKPGPSAGSQGLNIPSHGHNAMAVSGTQLLNIPNNMISPLSSAPQPSGPMMNQQSHGGFSFPSAASEAIQTPLIGPLQHAMPQGPMRAATPSVMPNVPLPGQSSARHPQPGASNAFPGSATNFDPVNSLSLAIPRPQQPSSSDFTFQPRHPAHAASQMWGSGPPPHQNIRPLIQVGQAPPPRVMRPMAHNLNPSPAQSFPMPPMNHQVNQQRGPFPTNFTGPQTGPLHPPLRGQNSVGPVMQGRNFVLPHPNANAPGPFPPRPGNQMHIQRFPGPDQHFGNHPGRPFSGSGPQQIYDPFSPSSVPFNPHKGGNTSRVHNESDPEYEDLMASVGVK